jgi:excisionase family DNA binding protein
MIHKKPETLSIEQAAKRLGVSRRTIYYRIKDGRLRSKQAVDSQRVLISSIEDYEAARENKK